MEISYRREMKRNYLVVEPESKKEAGYEERMLAGNHIQGLLDMRIKYREGQPLYYYDITSRQPLNRLLETRFITGDEICMILAQIHSALAAMEGFLLKEDGILLEPEYIYMEPELFQARLCLIPEAEGNFQERLSRFLQYILKRINHKDRECVVLAYGLYQESLKENFSMEDLLLLTASERNKEQKTGTQEEAGIENSMAETKWEEREDEAQSRFTGNGAMDSAPQGKIPKPSLPLRQQVIFWISAVLFLPALFWGLKGKAALWDFRFVFLGIDAGLLVLLIVGDILIVRAGIGRGPCSEEKGEENPWKILYEDEEEAPSDGSESSNEPHVLHIPKTPEGEPEPAVKAFAPCSNAPVTSELTKTLDEKFQTALLSDASCGSPICRLSSVQPSGEDIPISYVPFVIGKHKELADYVLSRDTVSRFHLRIDRDGERFFVTDLNSTNGTRVNNHLLEANETVEIKRGDEVYIAEMGYRFS